MVCPSVRGDNTRALAIIFRTGGQPSGLSYIQEDSQVDYLTYRWTAKWIILRTAGQPNGLSFVQETAKLIILRTGGQPSYNYFISSTPVYTLYITRFSC